MLCKRSKNILLYKRSDTLYMDRILWALSASKKEELRYKSQVILYVVIIV